MKNGRVKSIDALRTVSILAVLLIHTTTRVLEVTHYDLNTYAFTLFLNQFARFAVPLFFLISGFVLELSSPPDINYFEYLKKRFTKIVIPYIFWSLIYYYFIYNQNHDNLIKVFLTGNASYQLYFIPTLCIFYLLFPLLHKFYKYIANAPVIAGLGLIQVLLMNRDYTIQQFTFSDPIRVSILAYFVFILGIIAARNKDLIIKGVERMKYFLIILTGALIYYVYNEGRSRYFSIYNIEAFYSQWRISVLLYTVTFGSVMFGLFEGINEKLLKVIEKFSKLSYLVFFIHIIVLEQVWNYFGRNYFKMPAFDILFFALVSAFSFGAAYLIHKVPDLSKITG